jgi:hypothetical protein
VDVCFARACCVKPFGRILGHINFAEKMSKDLVYGFSLRDFQEINYPD